MKKIFCKDVFKTFNTILFELSKFFIMMFVIQGVILSYVTVIFVLAEHGTDHIAITRLAKLTGIHLGIFFVALCNCLGYMLIYRRKNKNGRL